MAKLANALDSGSNKATFVGSNPIIRTKNNLNCCVRDNLGYFLSKSQTWDIITLQRVYHQLPRAVYHHGVAVHTLSAT